MVWLQEGCHSRAVGVLAVHRLSLNATQEIGIVAAHDRIRIAGSLWTNCCTTSAAIVQCLATSKNTRAVLHYTKMAGPHSPQVKPWRNHASQIRITYMQNISVSRHILVCHVSQIADMLDHGSDAGTVY